MLKLLISKMFLISSFAIWGSALAQETDFSDETVVHVLDEPRHRTVLQDGQFIMIDMQLRPGDESLLHTHDQAIMINYISEPEGPQFGRLDVNIDYATEEFIHKINNPGSYLYQVIAILHNGNGEPLNNNDEPSGMELEPEIENNWFRAYSFVLTPGQSTLTQQHINPTVIVQGTEGLAHVSREDGITRELSHPGDWAYRIAGSSFRVTNVGNSPVTIAINEVRLQNSR